MLVSLRNKGVGARVVYDITGKEFKINPGEERTIDLADRVVDRFRTAESQGGTLAIRTEKESENFRNESFTLEEGENAPRKPASQTAGVANLKATQGQTLNELNKGPGMQKRYHGGPEEPRHKGPDLALDPDGSSQPKLHDPVTHAAQQQAAPKSSQEVARDDDPTTAAELVNRARDFSQDDLLRLANKMLPPNTLPMRPKPSQIMAALQEQIGRDEATRKATSVAAAKQSKVDRVRVKKKGR